MPSNRYGVPHYLPHIEDPDPPNPHMTDEEIEAFADKAGERMKADPRPWKRPKPLVADRGPELIPVKGDPFAGTR